MPEIKLHPSSLSDWEDCPRRAFWHFHNKQKDKDRVKNIAMSVGSAAHKVLQNLVETKGKANDDSLVVAAGGEIDNALATNYDKTTPTRDIGASQGVRIGKAAYREVMNKVAGARVTSEVSRRDAVLRVKGLPHGIKTVGIVGIADIIIDRGDGNKEIVDLKVSKKTAGLSGYWSQLWCYATMFGAQKASILTVMRKDLPGVADVSWSEVDMNAGRDAALSAIHIAVDNLGSGKTQATEVPCNTSSNLCRFCDIYKTPECPETAEADF